MVKSRRLCDAHAQCERHKSAGWDGRGAKMLRIFVICDGSAGGRHACSVMCQLTSVWICVGCVIFCFPSWETGLLCYMWILFKCILNNLENSSIGSPRLYSFVVFWVIFGDINKLVKILIFVRLHGSDWVNNDRNVIFGWATFKVSDEYLNPPLTTN